MAPTPCLISPVIFPMTYSAPPIIFLATSPVLFNNDPPASVRFFPTADIVEFTDWVTLFTAPDMFPVWFLVAFNSLTFFDLETYWNYQSKYYWQEFHYCYQEQYLIVGCFTLLTTYCHLNCCLLLEVIV